MSNQHYDVIIIGTGAGGGTLAHSLAPTGKKILILERGGWLPREKENWDPKAVFVQERYHTTEMWYDKQGRAFRPGTNYYVGGNTKVYGAVLLRMRERDFEQVTHYDGVSPEWPVKYSEWEPYYTRAERLYGAHGERGIDPTEPHASGPFPFPAVKHEPRMQEVYDGLKAQGWNPFPLPVGVRLDEEYRHLSQCIKCDTFDGFPCLVDGKYDSDTTCIRPAMHYRNVTLLTEAMVTRLKTDSSGKTVTQVEVKRNDDIEHYSADVVVVACGAINSAALLLRSANDRHPNGLANRSDQVGRNYMCHNNTAILSVSRKINNDKFTKTIGLNDYYWGADDFDYPLGHIQTLGKSLPAQLEGDAPSILIPGVGLTLDFVAKHAVDWWITTEDLPSPNNRVELTRNGDIMLSYTPNNQEPHKRLLAKLKHAMEHVEGGMTHFIPQDVYLSKQIPLAGVAHQCGTVRFGADPLTSALDVNCKAHDLDNLYVVDSSFFRSSSSSNPSLTIIANALRVGDHLMERLGVQASAATPNGVQEMVMA
ncbi:MAG: GMC family oxidoreductase [Anaerolineae bacterium]|nr:GMC family oxidoreductase [Anaerolineae bacterium]